MRSSDEFGLTLKYQFPVNKNQLNLPKCHLKTNGCQIITDSTVRLSYMVLAPVENQERISDADSFQITPFCKKLGNKIFQSVLHTTDLEKPYLDAR